MHSQRIHATGMSGSASHRDWSISSCFGGREKSVDNSRHGMYNKSATGKSWASTDRIERDNPVQPTPQQATASEPLGSAQPPPSATIHPRPPAPPIPSWTAAGPFPQWTAIPPGTVSDPQGSAGLSAQQIMENYDNSAASELIVQTIVAEADQDPNLRTEAAAATARPPPTSSPPSAVLSDPLGSAQHNPHTANRIRVIVATGH